MNRLLIFGIVILLAIAGFYFIYLNSPTGAAIALEEDPLSYGSEAIKELNIIDLFESNELHWDHMPLTYNLDSCKETFKGKIAKDIVSSLEFITQQTDGAVNFVLAGEGEEADLTYICDIGAVETKRNRGQETGYITQAEAVPYVYSSRNVYVYGEIYIYSSYPCVGDSYSGVIAHETLHLLGLDHNTKPYYTWDVMQPYVSNKCDLKILDKDVEYLEEIYS